MKIKLQRLKSKIQMTKGKCLQNWMTLAALYRNFLIIINKIN